MSRNKSRVTIHMAASLDGYVASKDADFSWMDSKDHFEGGSELTDEDINHFLESIDCYVIGSKTYELALELGWPYGEKPVFVLTNRKLPNDRKTVEFRSGNLNDILNQELKPKYPHIWMAGGPSLAKDFLAQGLADELIVSIIPILLGGGTPFFKPAGQQQHLHLVDSKAYSNGMVELTYKVKKA